MRAMRSSGLPGSGVPMQPTFTPGMLTRIASVWAEGVVLHHAGGGKTLG